MEKYLDDVPEILPEKCPECGSTIFYVKGVQREYFIAKYVVEGGVARQKSFEPASGFTDPFDPEAVISTVVEEIECAECGETVWEDL